MNILMDSGAYSAFSRSMTIELSEYIAFIKNNQHLLQHYISLDVIPEKTVVVLPIPRRCNKPIAIIKS
jgi:hypothetical protein